jgi:N-acetylmuramoyl-L-alanine amidase
LDQQPPGTTGLARRLNPEQYYVACRWDYDQTSKQMLADSRYKARVSAGGRTFLAAPSDWGPHQDTGRVADLSPALLEALGLETDDEVEVIYPADIAIAEAEMKLAMSSGHGRHIRGASGYIDEVTEARKVVERVAELLRTREVEVQTFHDNESNDQSENLNRIASWHNNTAFGGGDHTLDISVHFNAHEPTSKPMGSEVFYVTQDDVARAVSAAMAEAGEWPDRGAKHGGDLFFLNQTREPAILIEVCFVDSEYDAESYKLNFDDICQEIADALIDELAEG